MMAGGDEPMTTFSRISKTVGATVGLLDKLRRITQKSGEVIISFLRGPFCFIQRLIPSRVSGAVFSRTSFLKLDMACRTTGTLRNE